MRLIKRLPPLGRLVPGLRAADGDARVLDLFRNRIELKKAYNGLQEELRRLRDRLKQQTGVSARAQEALQALQARLAEPATAYSALVHFQLCAFGAQAHTSLAAFAAELQAQRETVEREQQQRDFQLQRALRHGCAVAVCNAQQQTALGASNEMARWTQAINENSGWWRYFKRRGLQQRLQAATRLSQRAADELVAARAERDRIAAEREPEFAGLATATRRAVNMAVIAHAQVYCDRLDAGALLPLMRDAIQPKDIAEYGDRSTCERLLQEIACARAALTQQVRVKEEVQNCARRLAAVVRYATDLDTVPDPLTLAEGTAGSRVLVDNLWQIQDLLLAPQAGEPVRTAKLATAA